MNAPRDTNRENWLKRNIAGNIWLAGTLLTLGSMTYGTLQFNAYDARKEKILESAAIEQHIPLQDLRRRETLLVVKENDLDCHLFGLFSNWRMNSDGNKNNIPDHLRTPEMMGPLEKEVAAMAVPVLAQIDSTKYELARVKDEISEAYSRVQARPDVQEQLRREHRNHVYRLVGAGVGFFSGFFIATFLTVYALRSQQDEGHKANNHRS